MRRAVWAALFLLLFGCAPALSSHPFGETQKPRDDVDSYLVVSSQNWLQATLYADGGRIGVLDMGEARAFKIPVGVMADGEVCFMVRLLSSGATQLGCVRGEQGADFQAVLTPEIGMSWVIPR